MLELVLIAMTSFVVSDVVEPIAPDVAAGLDFAGHVATGAAIGGGVANAVGVDMLTGQVIGGIAVPAAEALK